MMKQILAVLALGVTAGYISSNLRIVGLTALVSNYLFDLSLIALLFFMGLHFGADENSIVNLKKTGIKNLALPFATSFGSIFGGFIGGLLLRINVIASMGVCAGCGWYTLAGPLAGRLFGVEWAALGFTVNFMRELVTIATVPLTSKIDKYAPIAIGGATAMDTTLPLIVRYCGEDTFIAAFTSGFTITLITPFVITAIAALHI